MIGSTVGACSVLTSFDGLAGGTNGAKSSAPLSDGAVTSALDDASGSADSGRSPIDPSDASTPITSGNDATAGDATTNDAATKDAGATDASKPHDAAGAGGGDACVPTALACDGKVHLCNGVVNEGCPSAVGVGNFGSTQTLGGDTTTGTPFSDSCPAGQVLIGIGGSTGQWIDSLYGVCGTLGLTTSTTTTPYTYAVTITSGTTLPTRGTNGGTDTTWLASCPANEAVVGIAGNSGIAMDQLVLSCAPLLVTGSPSSFALTQGSSTTLPPEGDTTGGGPFAPVNCPSPQVIALVAGTDGQWMNSLGVACATPTITMIK
jgi:hypothetical protein